MQTVRVAPSREQSLHLFRALLRQVRRSGQSKGEHSLSRHLVDRVRTSTAQEASTLFALGNSYLSLIRAVDEKDRLYVKYEWGVSVDEKKRVMQSAKRVGLNLPEPEAESNKEVENKD